MAGVSEMLEEVRLGLDSLRLCRGSCGSGLPERPALIKGNRVVNSPMGWIRSKKSGIPVDSSKNKTS